MSSKPLLGCAPQPLGARNHCSCVPRSHLALEITARARLFVFGNTRKRRFSDAFSHIPLELTGRACTAATGRSESLFQRASKQFSPRNRGSSKRRWIRQHFRVSCGIPFGIALLRTLHCFELCLVRLHRHRQVPYANLACYFMSTPAFSYVEHSHRNRAQHRLLGTFPNAMTKHRAAQMGAQKWK